MKHKYIAATLFLAFTAPALADPPATDQAGPNPRAERMIQRLDSNGDGVISLDEFKYRGDRIIKDADLNGDGAVTLDELHTHHDQMMAQREARMKEMDQKAQARLDRMFKSMDTNGDGKVTLEEARAAAFKRMDKNGDGVLTADELTSKHRHWRRHEGGFAPPPGDGN